MLKARLFAAVLACGAVACTANNPGTGGAPASSGAAAPAGGGAPAAGRAAPGAPPAAGAASTPAGAAPASTLAAAPAAAGAVPAAPAPPAFVEVTVPSGTALSVSLKTPVSSDQSKVEDAVRATVAKAVTIDGRVVIPEGSELTGTVVEAERSGRVKGLATVAFRFNRLLVRNESFDIATQRIARQAEPTKKDDAKKVGLGAAIGGVVGAVAGGKKGLAVGAGVGAGAGTGAVLATRGDEVRVPAGTTIKATLSQALKINVPAS